MEWGRRIRMERGRRVLKANITIYQSIKKHKIHLNASNYDANQLARARIKMSVTGVERTSTIGSRPPPSGRFPS